MATAAQELIQDLDRLFAEYRAVADQYPASNPLLRLALEISNRLEAGTLDYDGLGDLVQHLTMSGFETRAAKLSRYSGEADPERNAAIIRAIVRAGPLFDDPANDVGVALRIGLAGIT